MRVASSAWHAAQLRRTILWTLGLKIFLLITVFDITVGTVHPFDLPKTVVSRGLAWVLAAFVGLAFVRYGSAVLPSTRLHLCVAVYLLPMRSPRSSRPIRTSRRSEMNSAGSASLSCSI